MNKKKTKLVSVVVPVFNSSSTLLELSQRLIKILIKMNIPYELIFIDDGSVDDSWKILESLQRKDKKIKIIQLNNNFGQHNALMCGFTYSKGGYIVTIDDDLQIPPEEIIKLYKKILEGYDLVYGEYLSKRHSFCRNLGSSLIQLVYKKIFQVSGNLTAFRIIRREIIAEILAYNRNYTFVDGLLAWHTKNIGYVDVKHYPRSKGKSGYSIRKLLVLSFNMLTNFSILPLQMASVTGFIMSGIGLIFAVYIIVKKLYFGIPVTGFASIIVSITIFSGTQLISIGLIGEYIGRIHLNLNNKPQYTIRKKILN